MKSFKELSRLQTFEERFDYLRLKGSVGRDTFGFERYLNQRFYRSREWQLVRPHVIARDLGFDLGIEGYDIPDRVIIHHMNPMSPEDIIEFDIDILNPDFLITTSHKTHNDIHYGRSDHSSKHYVERKPGDTKLW